MKRLSGRTLLMFLLAAVSLVLLILSSGGYLAPAEGAFATLSRPFLAFFNDIGQRASDLVAVIRDLATLRTINQQLQTQVDTLTIDNLHLSEVQAENALLRELLRFQQLNPTYDVRGGQVIARVIGRAPSNYVSTLAIDLGAAHGIEPGMPVVTERGLVGRILKVYPLSSTILLLTDSSSGVQGMLQRSRAVGVVTGQPGAEPIMEYIPQDADVSAGDLVITSGLGGTFPKNLVIGQVTQVHKRDFEMFQKATLRPTVDFQRLEFVLVITNFRPQPGLPDELESVG